MFIQRLKNLWTLSNFKITEFDNQLVITKKEGKLIFARSDRKAKIVELKTPVEILIEKINEENI